MGGPNMKTEPSFFGKITFSKILNSQQKKDLLSKEKRKHRKMKMGFFGRFAKKKCHLQKRDA